MLQLSRGDMSVNRSLVLKIWTVLDRIIQMFSNVRWRLAFQHRSYTREFSSPETITEGGRFPSSLQPLGSRIPRKPSESGRRYHRYQYISIKIKKAPNLSDAFVFNTSSYELINFQYKKVFERNFFYILLSACLRPKNPMPFWFKTSI